MHRRRRVLESAGGEQCRRCVWVRLQGVEERERERERSLWWGGKRKLGMHEFVTVADVTHARNSKSLVAPCFFPLQFLPAPPPFATNTPNHAKPRARASSMSLLVKNPARLSAATLLRSAAVYSRPSALPRPLLHACPLGTTRTFSNNCRNPMSQPGSDQDSKDSSNPLGKVSGIVNSILHGSGSLTKVMSQESWGVSLARGKYVHEVQSK